MVSTVTHYNSLEQQYFLGRLRNTPSEAHRLYNDPASYRGDTLHRRSPLKR